jgi:hypothetical protein
MCLNEPQAPGNLRICPMNALPSIVSYDKPLLMLKKGPTNIKHEHNIKHPVRGRLPWDASTQIGLNVV